MQFHNQVTWFTIEIIEMIQDSVLIQLCSFMYNSINIGRCRFDQWFDIVTDAKKYQ